MNAGQAAELHYHAYVAIFLLTGVAAAVIVLLAALVAQAGARPSGERVGANRSALRRPRHPFIPGGAGMTSASTRPLAHSEPRAGGVPRVRSTPLRHGGHPTEGD